MDWFATLLDAAGVPPERDHSPDGISLLPVLTGESGVVCRKLFWRYRVNRQRAMRDGDFKYLKIRDNTFLFNLADDPRSALI